MSTAATPLRAACAIAMAVVLVLTAGCSREKAEERPPVPANEELAAHSAEFERGVVEVTDGIHVAIGYGLANSMLIEGDDGAIIVDTLESAEAARPVKEAFDRITSKPLRAIIYTHNHADHVFGAGVLAGDAKPEVISHASTVTYLDRIINIIRPAIYRRSMRQFGTYLREGELVNCGIGPQLVNDATTTVALLRPNRTFEGERMEVKIAGVELVLVHAPGETPDQIFVWLPERRVLLPGDNFYKSFPNLYAIRGTAYRDVLDWVASLDRMRALEPEYLIPSHTRPLEGKEAIAEALTDYRDAIQFVHDQTVRAMNRGLTPEQAVEVVRLPPHLSGKPYLREYYGRVDWSVKSIYSGYLGWFGGNASELQPLAVHEHADRLARLANGSAALLTAARDALSTDSASDEQWALELPDAVIALGEDSNVEEARALRARALRAIAARQLSANARNYYLTQALEAEGAVDLAPPDPSTAPDDLLESFPVVSFLRAMIVNLDPEKSAEVNTVAALSFPDLDEHYTLHVRRGVAELQAGLPASADLSVTVDSFVWKQLLTGKRNAAAAIAAGDVEVDGGRIALARFLLLFR